MRRPSDFYSLRRSSIVDGIAFLGFAAGLVLAMALRYSMLIVDFRHGNLARAMLEFSKVMFEWGVVGGLIGLATGALAGRLWQSMHQWRRDRRSRVAEAAVPLRSAPVLRRPATDVSAQGTWAAAHVEAPANIRYSEDRIEAEPFLTLSRRVWPANHDPARVASALERTVNIGAWDGDRLVGAVRVLTDGYYLATVPEVVVDPAYRRHGIGRELMRRALEHAPRHTLVIGATSDSVGFFQRLGCDVAPMGFVMRRSPDWTGAA